MSFISSSSFSSASSKFSRAARAAAGVAAGFLSSRAIRGFSAVYPAGLGWLRKTVDIARAPASKDVIGRSPKRYSIVRSMDVVLYIVPSTARRFVQDEITKPGERCEST